MSKRSRCILTAAFFTSSLALAADSKPKGAEEAIRSADQEWSRVFAAKDLDKSVGMCGEKASVPAPNQPRATGLAAIAQLFSGFFALPDLAISWEPSEIHVSRSGELGYSSGTYRMTFKDPTGKTISDRGKYATVWEKQDSGAWQVVLDAFNTDLPLVSPTP